jgi:hypothetical protein
MKLAVIAAAFAALFFTAQAQAGVVCQTYGGTTYCQDQGGYSPPVTCQTYGNTTYCQ